MLYCAAMARQFLIFLLTVVALQFSWTAVSVYCGHESGGAARHFGHHQHTGHDAGTQAEQPSLAKKLTPHTDCSSCSHAPLAPAAHDTVLAHATLNRSPRLQAPPAPSSAYPPPPERPQWRHAA